MYLVLLALFLSIQMTFAHPVSVSYGSIYLDEGSMDVEITINVEDFFFFKGLTLDKLNRASGRDIAEMAGGYGDDIRQQLFCLNADGDTLMGDMIDWNPGQELPSEVHLDSLGSYQVTYHMHFKPGNQSAGLGLTQCFGGLRSPIQAISIFQVFQSDGRSFPVQLSKGEIVDMLDEGKPFGIRSNESRKQRNDIGEILELNLKFKDYQLDLSWTFPFENDPLSAEANGTEEKSYQVREEYLNMILENLRIENQDHGRLKLELFNSHYSGASFIIHPRDGESGSENQFRLFWRSFELWKKVRIDAHIGGEKETFTLTKYRPLAVLERRAGS